MTAFPNQIRRSTKLFAAALGAGALAAPLAAQTAAPATQPATQPATRPAAQALNQITLTAPRPLPTPKPFARLSASAHALRDSLIALTRLQLGVPYRLGQSSPEAGFDCSGLAKYVMAQFGTRLPRTSHEQALVGKKIERNIAALKPGDLLTFGHGRRVSHVAIYIGNGIYVHAPVPGSTVREESLANTKPSWWKGARRVITLDDAANTDSVLN